MNAEMRADRDQALTVVCPETRCTAAAGQVCLNLGTGLPLARQAAHLARLRAAGVNHAPWDVRDLRRGD